MKRQLIKEYNYYMDVRKNQMNYTQRPQSQAQVAPPFVKHEHIYESPTYESTVPSTRTEI